MVLMMFKRLKQVLRPRSLLWPHNSTSSLGAHHKTIKQLGEKDICCNTIYNRRNKEPTLRSTERGFMKWMVVYNHCLELQLLKWSCSGNTNSPRRGCSCRLFASNRKRWRWSSRWRTPPRASDVPALQLPPHPGKAAHQVSPDCPLFRRSCNMPRLFRCCAGPGVGLGGGK